MSHHIIKFSHKDGVKLLSPEVWCGEEINGHSWLFQSAQHAALSVGGSISMCKNCIKNIVKELSKELE